MELSEIVKKYKSEGFKKSNNLMGVSFLRELQNEDALKTIESENGLYFLDTSKFIFHMYYYINFDKEAEFNNLLNNDCIIEIIDKENKRRNEEHIVYWENNGFEHFGENVEMRLDEPKLNYKSRFKLTIPNEDDYKEIIFLYETGLDPVINSYPSIEEFKVLIDKKEIFVYKKENKIVSAITRKEYKNHYLLSHIIVDKICRGLGIGIDMIMGMLENINKKVLLWVSRDNLNARKIYEKLGFKYTDKISVQLIRRASNDRK
ncbi:GNAT family N-acetyltransferase [Helcococcus kunzii]|uniref:GNAT family N-acetyltransferase n=1 Tax=Helcococcus kunzii TaxID=40091 RepID=UPI0038A85B0C